ncbi:MAG: hypothetical protein DME57_00765 [Verrucomicrobia bacterium]|nr:MAG: hypothetical protein DME57_00765 [Verrucomicrobiota bacterium]
MAAEAGDGLPAAEEDLAVLVAAAEALAAAVRVPAGKLMRTKEFLSKLEHDLVVQAIRDAESKTSGEIRVFIQRGEVKGDALVAAQKRFHRLGLHKNAHHNDVLIWVAPRAHKFAVVGDEAIHQKCGDELWQRLIEQMRDHFRNEKFTAALVDAIGEIGDAVAAHFPQGSTSTGSQPDEVIEG